MLKLPWIDAPHWVYTTTIDGFTIQIKADWLESFWFLSFLDATGNPIVSSRKVSPNNQINPMRIPANFPTGTFIVLGPNDSDLTRTSFNEGFALYYVSVAYAKGL